MSEIYREQATKLADQFLLNIVSLDQTTDGNPIYLARALELPGCLAQGKTSGEALMSLIDARIDYIESLLEDGLPVPRPGLVLGTTDTRIDESISPTYFYADKRNEDEDEYEVISVGALIQA